jgi:hypothetical protein
LAILSSQPSDPLKKWATPLTNEIEITPAAGMDVYEDFSGSFGLEQLLMAVYIAMDHASPSGGFAASLRAPMSPRLYRSRKNGG